MRVAALALCSTLVACSFAPTAGDVRNRDAAPDSHPSPDALSDDARDGSRSDALDAHAAPSGDLRPGLDDASGDGTGSDNGDGTGHGTADAVVVLPDGAVVAMEVCGNGLDDDRDGHVDEGCACLPGASQACYGAAEATAGVGICRRGTQHCGGTGEFGTWDECAGAQGPVEELCADGIDQDCNGAVDDRADCVCVPDAVHPCYSGPDGTADVGICHGGTTTCNPSGTVLGACTGEVVPATEVCGNHIDDDCNGRTDDAPGCVCDPSDVRPCYAGPAGTMGVGPCHAGTQSCDASGTMFGACTGAVLPSPEVCGNHVDDDCNGRTDEAAGCVCDPGVSRSCYTGLATTEGVGICRAGMQTCNAGGTAYGACTGVVLPGTEVCGNGVDEDCNGLTDDAPGCVCTVGASRSCYGGPTGTAGVGICRAGTQQCNATGTAWGACTGAVLPATEICANHVDEDCSGVADDGAQCVCEPTDSRACYPGPAADATHLPCHAGTQRCAADGLSFGTCTGAVVAGTETCMNNVDDDCDGMTDEGCVTLVEVPVSLSGDCLTAHCPPATPYAVGCSITMAGGDSRGCVANRLNSSDVYFQEGNACGAGHVMGTLQCSNMPTGIALNATNCVINKPTAIYATSSSGCPQ